MGFSRYAALMKKDLVRTSFPAATGQIERWDAHILDWGLVFDIDRYDPSIRARNAEAEVERFSLARAASQRYSEALHTADIRLRTKHRSAPMVGKFLSVVPLLEADEAGVRRFAGLSIASRIFEFLTGEAGVANAVRVEDLAERFWDIHRQSTDLANQNRKYPLELAFLKKDSLQAENPEAKELALPQQLKLLVDRFCAEVFRLGDLLEVTPVADGQRVMGVMAVDRVSPLITLLPLSRPGIEAQMVQILVDFVIDRMNQISSELFRGTSFQFDSLMGAYSATLLPDPTDPNRPAKVAIAFELHPDRAQFVSAEEGRRVEEMGREFSKALTDFARRIQS